MIDLLNAHPILSLFVIITFGLLLGRMRVFGFSLESSGILFVALYAGYLGIHLPMVLKSLGLILFIYAVGLQAGPRFLSIFKNNGVYFNLLAFIIVSSAAILVLIGKSLLKLPTELAVGIFSGSLTSTPGLAAAQEATQSPLTSIGYGVAYPFGVMAVILFLKLFQAKFKKDLDCPESMEPTPPSNIERTNSNSIFTGLLFGVLLGMFPFVFSIKMGITGGVLISALVLSAKKNLFSVVWRVPNHIIYFMRELGLALFLTVVGTSSGSAIGPTISQHGVSLILFTLLVAVIPMVLAAFIGVYLFKLRLLSMTGVIAGGMTSTPGLCVATGFSTSAIPMVVYATVYPLSMIFMIIWTKILVSF